MKWMNIPVLVLVASLFLSLLSGLNQTAGFFSRISLPTAILSVVLALIVAVAFPVLLRKERPQGETVLRMPVRLFSIVLALVILAAGVGPFLGKFWVAEQSKSEGMELVDLHQYGPARAKLDRAARYFEDLGFGKRSVESKLGLIQVYAGLGDRARAEELIAEVEHSGSLDEFLQGKLYTIRGSIAYEHGEFEQAEHLYQIALTTIKPIDPRSKAHAALLQNQAVLWAGRGAPYRDRVLDNYRQAREIYQELNDEVGLAHILLNEGNLYENDPPRARALYEQALSAAEEIDDPYLVGKITTNIGLTYRKQGDLDRAEDLYLQARLRFEEAADRLGQADVLVNLATVEWVRGNRELARQHVQASESYLRNIDLEGEQTHPRKVAVIRTFQADIYDKIGESETAESHYQEALSIFSKHPDPLQEAGTQVNYAGLLLRLNRGEEARNQLGRAREILEAYSGEGPHQSLGVLYSNLGIAYQGMGDLPNALEYHGKAVEIFDAIGERLLHAQARENTGVVRGFQGDIAEAEGAFLEALDIYRELGNRDYEARCLFNLYTLYSVWGEPSAPSMVPEILTMLEKYSIDQEIEAGILFGIMVEDIGDEGDLIRFRERLRQLERFYEQREERIGLGRSLLDLAEVEQKLGNYPEMLKYAQEAEAYADDIPLPLRISFHTDLGFYLLESDNPEDAIDHLLEAFDLAEIVSVDQQRSLAVVIGMYISIWADDIDREKYRRKAQLVIDTTDDAVILDTFQAIVDLLSPAQD